MCVPPVSRHSPLPHQPAVTEAESDLLGCQPARLLLPQKLLVATRLPPVLHTWTGRETAAPVQGLYKHHIIIHDVLVSGTDILQINERLKRSKRMRRRLCTIELHEVCYLRLHHIKCYSKPMALSESRL